MKIKDTGIGISPKNINKIFNRFSREQHKGNKKMEGSGIGLYLVADIIQQHGGIIHVQGEEGKGSVFSFSLPLSFTGLK